MCWLDCQHGKKDMGQYIEGERGWIPISRRLPDADWAVLVADRNGTIVKMNARYRNLQTGQSGWLKEDNGITHWMPLPESPAALEMKQADH
jgi:hypothetical protein